MLQLIPKLFPAAKEGVDYDIPSVDWFNIRRRMIEPHEDLKAAYLFATCDHVISFIHYGSTINGVSTYSLMVLLCMKDKSEVMVTLVASLTAKLEARTILEWFERGRNWLELLAEELTAQGLSEEEQGFNPADCDVALKVGVVGTCAQLMNDDNSEANLVSVLVVQFIKESARNNPSIDPKAIYTTTCFAHSIALLANEAIARETKLIAEEFAKLGLKPASTPNIPDLGHATQKLFFVGDRACELTKRKGLDAYLLQEFPNEVLFDTDRVGTGNN
jgi:hypothetical protein